MFTKKTMDSTKIIAKIKTDIYDHLPSLLFLKKKKLSLEQRVALQSIIQEAQNAFEKGEYDVAKNYIVQGFTIDRYNKELNMLLASLYVLENNFEKAEYIYRDLILLYKNDVRFLQELVDIYTSNKKYDLAIKIYTQLLKLEPEKHEYLFQIAKMYFEMKEFEKSIEYIHTFLEKVPESVPALSLLALCYQQVGKEKESLEILQFLENKQS